MADMKCPCCNGRGYHRCDCWPGDCICGWGDETCEECGGDGFFDPDEWPDQDNYRPEASAVTLGAIAGCR